jgi:stage IV sporulation protein FB
MGNGAIRLFNFRGHSVSVAHTYLFLIMFVLATGREISHGVIFVFAISFSILWHEFGHAFAFQRYNCGPSDILLHGFGGETVNPWFSRLPRKKSMFVSFAGPLAGLILGLPLMGLWIAKQYQVLGPDADWTAYLYLNAESTLLDYLLMNLVYINIVWSVFNLLPIWPMDGGMIFRQFIAKWSKKSYYYTGSLSMILLAPLLFLAISVKEPFLAIILVMLGFQSFQLIKAPRIG